VRYCRPVRGALLAGVFASAVAGACASPGDEAAHSKPVNAPDGRALRAVDLPDLSATAPSVQKQIRERHAAVLATLRSGGKNAAELGSAYGEMGKLLMAAQYPDAAEPWLANAGMLDPRDFRWPYYLAHLYRGKGDLARSLELFDRANELHPDDVSTLVWRGELALAQGKPDVAEPSFARALSLQPGSLSARFGLGRTALAKKDFQRAVTYLEDVLARDPGASGAHYPLALAYEGLGRAAKADEHRRLRREHEILPADPLMVELEEMLDSPLTYEKLGIRALERKDWPAAAGEFRKGLALDPGSAALRHRLGTALAMMGDDSGARAQFEEAVRVDPGYARAQYSLGVMAASGGGHAEAIQRFSTALEREPGYAEARLGLALSLRRSGRPGESLAHYARVLQDQPQHVEAALGEALALVQLQRYRAARDRLIAGTDRFRDDGRFAHALARLLASAPDDAVRDGARAAALVEELLAREQRSLELGETMAMAMAELGRFDDAVAIQRQLIAGATKAGLQPAVRRLSENLARYERREACRRPWAADEMP
jgi:tetratricopeptide (TPR) repeat protein